MKTPVPLTNVPSRLFDLIPYYINKYADHHDCIFGGKVDGKWVKYDGKSFKESTDNISLGLLQLGVCKGDRVAIAASNCPEWNMVDFAVQQIGAILVPIYTTISQSDYNFIFQNAEPKVTVIDSILTYKKLQAIPSNQFSGDSVFSIIPVEGVRPLGELMETGKSEPSNDTLVKRMEEVRNDDVATIIYTSGTIGTPKGVMLTHKNILSMVKQLCPVYTVDETHDVISFLPLSHIYERAIMYCHVYLGTATYYAENVGTIMRDIQEIRPKSFSSVPRFIEKVYTQILRKEHKLDKISRHAFNKAMRFAENYDETGKSKHFFYRNKRKIADIFIFRKIRKLFGGRLEFIIMGGAATSPRLVKAFSAFGIPLIEGYGLTETSPVITTNSMVTGKIKAGSVGEPLPDVKVKIAKDGEILVKGDSVFAGYYKDPEATSEAFDSEGYFHTGDIGEMDNDGMLHITGRIKEIFKTSMGKFVSPATIECGLCESPAISQALVVGDGRKFVGALIVPDFSYLMAWCESNNIKYESSKTIVKNHDVNILLRKEIEKVNSKLGSTEQIRKFEVITDEWTIDSGEMTPSLKLKRRVLMEKHHDLIEKIYEER